MKRLLITGDIHGNFSAWLTIRALMAPEDGLVVAGDLFDTRYGGSFSDPDYSPESIKKAVSDLDLPFYYVYGNCDEPWFCPGYDDQLEFTAAGRCFFLHHGHAIPRIPDNAQIIVQGHTHSSWLTRKDGRIFLNPGSIARPRDRVASYAIADQTGVRLIELKTGKTLACLEESNGVKP